MPTLRLNRLLLTVLGLLLAASSAHAWWDSAWPLRKKIAIDTSATGVQIADTIGPVPLLIRLHDGNFAFGSALQDGSDLRFVAEDDKTVLPHHLEKWDPVLNEAFVWVKIPDLKPGVKTSLWLYYGNGKPPVAATTEPKATYDNDTVLVYHFGEHGTPAVDATGHGNNSAAAGAASDGAIIGTGLRLDGRSPLTIPASDSLNWIEGPSVTLAAWVKFGAPQPAATLLTRRDGARAFTLVVDRNTLLAEVGTDAGVQRSPWAAPVTANAWHHLAVVTNGTGTTIFVDGETYTTLPSALPALSTPIVLGAEAPNSTIDRAKFVGEIDELEISKLARTASFLKFAAVGQGADGAAKLLAIGDEEQPKNWLSWLKGGYVGIILDSLSVDGWVVIGILMLMMLISWIVMIGKALYLNRVAKGNSVFLKEWRHVATDLSVLDTADGDKSKSLGGRVDAATMRIVHAAPLYRLYHVGVEEIQHRMSADRAGAAKVLSARSIQAIRASLDGTLVRETHRLSSQMVLLTIAISGGPFLGLLGTVVGVMITFAAVAAAGDVNVNAIAPGIAAALAATVAGLAVAIPALFGYNYLLTRVKSATSDMHVFIDEFVAKMAEFYSEPGESNRGATRAPFNAPNP